MKQAKLRHCWYCGAEMGVYVDYHRMDTCGNQVCERAARDPEAALRRVSEILRSLRRSKARGSAA